MFVWKVMRMFVSRICEIEEEIVCSKGESKIFS